MEKGLAEGQLQKINQTHTRITTTGYSASVKRKKKKRNQKKMLELITNIAIGSFVLLALIMAISAILIVIMDRKQ